MGASVTPQTPPNTITFTPGGTVVINGSAIGGNNAVSIQIQNKEICYIDSSGNLNTASGSAFITSIAAPAAASANGLSVSGTALSATPADGTHPGIVTTAAQTFAGVKTFSGGIVSDISGNTGSTLNLTSTVTDGAAAVAFQFQITPAIVAGGAKLFSLKNGVTEVMYFDSANGFHFPYSAIYVGGVLEMTGVASSIVWPTAGSTAVIYSFVADGSSAVGLQIYNQASLTTAGSKLLMLSNVAVEKCSWDALYGRFNTTFSDQSGAPGVTATCNAASGRFALSSGNASITVTCAACTSANSIVLCQAETDLGTALRYKVVPGVGSFVLTTAVVAPTNLKFSFSVINP